MNLIGCCSYPKMVHPVGIEPTSTALQTAAMTTSAKGALYLVSLPGFEPGPHGPKPCTQPDNALER